MALHEEETGRIKYATYKGINIKTKPKKTYIIIYSCDTDIVIIYRITMCDAI